MAIINKTGITTGGTIQAEHVTRVIDALSGVSSDTIVATGSFSGSFTGTITGNISTANSANAVDTAKGADNSNHYLLFVNNEEGSQTPLTDVTLKFNPNSNSLTLTGSLTTSGSLSMMAVPGSTVNFSSMSSSGQFVLPLIQPTSPNSGAVYFDSDSGRIFVWSGTEWLGYAPA